MQLIQVESVDALLCPHQDVLVPCLRMNPAGCAVDLERTPIEHLAEACAHVNLGGGRETIGGRLGW